MDTIKKISRREQIITEASKLFREKGYNASSMRLLADRIGMEAASLYNHISSKEELLKEICFGVAKKYLDHLSHLEETGVAPQEKVREIIRFQIEIMMDSYELVYVSQRDWKHLGEPWLAEFLEKRRHYEKRFADIIAEGIERGAFRKMEPYVAVLGILAAIRAVEYWQRQPKNITADVFANDLVEMLMTGLNKSH